VIPGRIITEVATGDKYVELPVHLIFWKDPIRKDIKTEDVNNMATSFMMHGQIEPIVVDEPNEGGKYEGVCGRLRYEATKRFQGRPVLARVHKFKSALEKREWQLAENLHRKDITAMQRAEAYKELYDGMRAEHGGEVKDKNIVFTIAQRQEKLTGEKAPAEKTIYKYIEVAKLPEEVKAEILVDENFGVEHGVQLLRLKNMPSEQLKLAEQFAKEPMTVQVLKKEVDEILNPPEPKPTPVTTDVVVNCPICGESYQTIHVEEGKHKLERITGENP